MGEEIKSEQPDSPELLIVDDWQNLPGTLVLKDFARKLNTLWPPKVASISSSWNPLSALTEATDVSGSVEFVATLLADTGVVMTPERRSDIAEALRATAAANVDREQHMVDFVGRVQDLDVRRALHKLTLPD